MAPLHFRASSKMNQEWLRRVFGGKNQKIEALQVPYGNLKFQFIPRRYDAEYAKSQLALILHVAAEYGGIGAKVQHGFGQFLFPSELNISLSNGLQDLQATIQMGFLRAKGPVVSTPFDLRNFVSITYEIPGTRLDAFTKDQAHIGKEDKKRENRYIPCAFDLRYKGTGNYGMRRWLKRKGWKETTDPNKLEELDILLGPRSQWGKGRNSGKIEDDFRTASRVFFGMPYLKQGSQDTYILRVWAFWPSELKSQLATPQELKTLLDEYIQYAFDKQARKVSDVLGEKILNHTPGGTK